MRAGRKKGSGKRKRDVRILNRRPENQQRENIEKSGKSKKDQEGEASPRVERRKERRIPVEIEVRYFSGESFAVDWMMNISRGGMFIRTSNPLPPGTPLRIHFSIPGSEEEVYAEGVVRWKADQVEPNVLPGMGIEITKIDERSKKILDRFVDENLRKQERRGQANR